MNIFALTYLMVRICEPFEILSEGMLNMVGRQKLELRLFYLVGELPGHAARTVAFNPLVEASMVTSWPRARFKKKCGGCIAKGGHRYAEPEFSCSL